MLTHTEAEGSHQSRVPTEEDTAPYRILVQDWTDLQVGQRVQVESTERAQGTGTVDAVMADGSAVWLQMQDGRGRIIFLVNDAALWSSA